ncbi:MAG: IS630 family transposase [bacterium]
MNIYKIHLTGEEREWLNSIIKKGKVKAKKYRQAMILINCDETNKSKKHVTNEMISKVLNVGMRTIDRVKKTFVEEGIDIVLDGKPRKRQYDKKMDGDSEAHLIALSCSKPPEGYAQWSLRLLADKMVELEYVESLSHETVRRVLKKNEIKPWRSKGWIIPPESSSEFVASMEHVLDVYKRPYNPRNPVICMDESPKQLILDTRKPIGGGKGKIKKYDYEYIRKGVVNIFMCSEPLIGQRYVKITESKKKKDWAVFMKEISEFYDSNVDKITLVMDNYGTHTRGAFYETFEPVIAKSLLDRFEFVFTPKHGSWLNVAEIELNVLQGQCLNRRIGDIETIIKEVSAWQNRRNVKGKKVEWQFTVGDARIKLNKLYPPL